MTLLTSQSVLLCLLFALSTFTTVSAQQLLNFGNGALPTCAEGCAFLSQAQAACTPPENPVSNEATYLNCFCQSGYLTALKSDPSAVCGSVCSGSDLTQIATWYASVCSATEVPTNPTTTTTPATTTTTQAAAAGGQTTGTQTTNAAGATISSTSGDGSSTPTYPQPRPWWSTHWRWILMIILVFVLLGAIAWGAIWYRRRQRRKRDQMSSRFNDGITTRSMGPVGMVENAPPVGFAYSPHPRGRRTPSMISQDGQRVVAGSTTTLSRVREEAAGRHSALGAVSSSSDEESPDSRVMTPQPARDIHSSKGKARERISEEEV